MGALMFDLSHTYDLVDYVLILNRLNAYGVRDVSHHTCEVAIKQ